MTRSRWQNSAEFCQRYLVMVNRLYATDNIGAIGKPPIESRLSIERVYWRLTDVCSV
jgi:hypothetical protein